MVPEIGGLKPTLFVAFDHAAFRAPSDANKSFAARNRSAVPSNGILNLNLSCPSSAYTRGCA